MSDDNFREFRLRRDEWLATPHGAFAALRMEELLAKMVSPWPRRTRSMVVLGAGSGDFLEVLWQTGFDVTGQDHDPEYAMRARARMKNRAGFMLCAPDHLPVDDCTFDYGVATDIEFWDDPEAVLRELARVSCRGVVLLFSNAWSLARLECLTRKERAPAAPMCAAWLSPRKVRRLARQTFECKAASWGSILLGPGFTWRHKSWHERLNTLMPALPLGAFAALRVDFQPLRAGTPLVLRAGAPAVSAE